jgi:hypothetical protein
MLDVRFRFQHSSSRFTHVCKCEVKETEEKLAIQYKSSEFISDSLQLGKSLPMYLNSMVFGVIHETYAKLCLLRQMSTKHFFTYWAEHW